MENTIELYISPKRKQNESKHGTLAEGQCICCMKPIKNGAAAFTVHMNTDWLVVHPSISEEDCLEITGTDSQGCFDVGPECAKKMKGFTTRNRQE